MKKRKFGDDELDELDGMKVHTTQALAMQMRLCIDTIDDEMTMGQTSTMGDAFSRTNVVLVVILEDNGK